MLPPITLKHIQTLTDDTGIQQHAKYAVPNRFEGYCTDDNVRALIVAAKHYNIFGDALSLELVKTYMAYTFYSQNEDGTMHNFMDYQRNFLDTISADDVLGRTLWACGYIISSNSIPFGIREVARIVFNNGLKHADKFLATRPISYSLLGLYYCIDDLSYARDEIERLANKMLNRYRNSKGPDWEWFEDFMSYANARLPQAMFLAYDALKMPEYLECAESSLQFLWDEVQTAKGVVCIVGNDSWYIRGRHRALWDQQAIDVGALVEAFVDAYRITNKPKYHQNALTSFEWFLGNNLLKSPVYDPTTGGCFDGLSLEKGVNQNQGAESTIACLLARLALEEVRRPS